MIELIKVYDLKLRSNNMKFFYMKILNLESNFSLIQKVNVLFFKINIIITDLASMEEQNSWNKDIKHLISFMQIMSW